VLLSSFSLRFPQHPYLLCRDDSIEDEQIKEYKLVTNDDKMHHLLSLSGKFVLLDKLLAKLFAQGSKVLIFTQYVLVLNMLDDYLNWRGYKHERLDGSTAPQDRQSSIDRFSRPGSDRFVFMLSTKAGGVGINLTAADIVIIFDSDINPQGVSHPGRGEAAVARRQRARQAVRIDAA
jgi:chromodomain-helicase-DNA-binding protein 7